ncbi:hypothetical protein BDF14DRAFT_1745945 [Spinellus fusiger]|nr:hypothetical protein BDF14DRAFT_1745945 [Spinellus fusiger]
MSPLSIEKRNNVEILLRQGKSSRSIAKLAGVSKSTATNIRRRLGLAIMNKGGRPSKLTPAISRLILRRFNSGRYKNTREAAIKLREEGTIVVPNTIGNLLKRYGWQPNTSVCSQKYTLNSSITRQKQESSVDKDAYCPKAEE